MSPKRSWVGFWPGRGSKSLFARRRRVEMDENYPEHITSWATNLKGSIEGIRDDSTDLQKKYEHAPLRRKRQAKKSKLAN